MTDSKLDQLLELKAILSSHVKLKFQDRKELQYKYDSLKSELEEKLEKLKILDREDWIAIERKVFKSMRKENKELEQQVKKLQEELNKINDIVGHVTIDEILQALKLMKLVEEESNKECFSKECMGCEKDYIRNLLEEAKK